MHLTCTQITSLRETKGKLGSLKIRIAREIESLSGSRVVLMSRLVV